MVQHLDIVEDLEKLSKELIERKHSVDCIDLIQNDTAKQLITDDNARSMLANLIIYNHLLNSQISLNDKMKNDTVHIKTILQNGIHTTDLAKECQKKGAEIAEKLFGTFKITDDSSKSNLSNILAARMFASGRLINEQSLNALIDSTHPVVGNGQHTSKLVGPTFSQAFYNNFKGMAYGWYAVEKLNCNHKPTDKHIEFIKQIDAILDKALTKGISQHMLG
jgi:hypothetical protein